MTPKEVSALADKWWLQQAKRLAAKHKMEELEKIEVALKTGLLAALEKEGISSIGGKKVHVTLKRRVKPAVGNWQELYDYIQKTGEFDLLQKRLTESAVSDRWEDEVEIPGVYPLEVAEISYSKVKSSK